MQGSARESSKNKTIPCPVQRASPLRQREAWQMRAGRQQTSLSAAARPGCLDRHLHYTGGFWADELPDCPKLPPAATILFYNLLNFLFSPSELLSLPFRVRISKLPIFKFMNVILITTLFI